MAPITTCQAGIIPKTRKRRNSNEQGCCQFERFVQDISVGSGYCPEVKLFGDAIMHSINLQNLASLIKRK